MALPRATSSSSSLWIFGYGSLVWNPGFEYRSSQVGFITGYSRRFWQGNVNHRGTCEQPGRVATLVEESEAVTWGRAFQLKDESSISALDYLNCRETSLGGYITKIVNFQPKMAEKPETPEKKFEESENPTEDSVESQTSEPTCFPVLLYMATTDNPFYLGPAPIQEIASQIVNTRGTCGHNVEYVLRLAEFMKKNVPNVHDVHLFTLECHILEILKEKRVCVESVMGDFRPNVESPEVDGGDEAAARPNNFLFTLTLPIKKRCLSA